MAVAAEVAAVPVNQRAEVSAQGWSRVNRGVENQAGLPLTGRMVLLVFVAYRSKTTTSLPT